ncbi:MAG: patatin-like phospholipase family protein [Variibacter sp.]|nr:patatin-like phospholipase family protein [Variibacter sp.]
MRRPWRARRRAVPAAPAPPAGEKKINLGLQGGGAHGAFTWGVLDYLLEDGRLAIEGISGASAGAVNAVVLADGLVRGGREEARRRLAAFWRAASRDGALPEAQRKVLDRLFWFAPGSGSPMQAWLEALSQYFSPYDLNPLNINPLRDLIERFVDFDAIRRCERLRLFISATNVQTGRLRVFPREAVTADVVMASAALPLLFRAVEIDGVPYWDGGYMGNPVLFPLYHTTETEDLLIVQINPLRRDGVPTSAKEIMNRINEITFNSSLLAELRAIEFVGRLIDEGRLRRGSGAGEYRRINVHRIALANNGLPGDSKLNNDFDFFQMLHRAGRRAARRFLDAHYDDIGVRGTVDLKSEVRAEWG